MKILIVASGAEKWDLSIPGVEIVTPRKYIADPKYVSYRGTRVVNLSRSYKYQSNGYYVSLLAAARGHRPMPQCGICIPRFTSTPWMRTWKSSFIRVSRL